MSDIELEEHFRKVYAKLDAIIEAVITDPAALEKLRLALQTSETNLAAAVASTKQGE